MAWPMFLIREITPTLKRWSAKVLVESKGDPRQSTNSPKRFQPLILIDEEGNRVNATIYDTDIAKFENTLNVFQTYSISNARVCEPKSGVVNSVGTYHWVINSKTVVNKLLNDVIPRRVATPRYVPLSDITPLPVGSTVDILVLLIASFGYRVVERVVNGKKQRYTVAEFGVVDDRRRPLVLSLWNNVATSEGSQLAAVCHTNPVISVTKLTTSSYYGLSLGSTPNTTISVNPDLPAARKLQSWYTKNPDLKQEHVQAVETTYRQRKAVVDANAIVIPISSADDLDYDARFTVRGTVQIVDDEQKFFYMACEECTAPYNAEYNWTIECRTCNQTTHAKPRSVVVIQISDESGDLSAAVFGEDANKMLGKSAHQCMEYYDSGITIPLAPVNEMLSAQTYTLQLKKTLRQTAREDETRYIVLALTGGLPAVVEPERPGPVAPVGDTPSPAQPAIIVSQPPVACIVSDVPPAVTEDEAATADKSTSEEALAQKKGKALAGSDDDSSDSDTPVTKRLKIG